MARFTENEIKVIKQFNLNYDNILSLPFEEVR